MKDLLRDVFHAARATAVLVATLIGAGYATGREVSQYFGRANVATLVFSALCMGLLCTLFLYIGTRTDRPRGKVMQVYRVVLSVAAVVSCGTMISAGKTLLSGAGVGILTALGGVALAMHRRVFCTANLVAVPVLVGLVLVAYCGAVHIDSGTSFLPLSAANYAGMNLLFEGELLRREGKGMTPRGIVLSGVGIAACMGLLMVLMHRMVGASSADLPFAEVCAAQGKEGIVQAVILTSILTNIAGCMRLCLDTWQAVMPMGMAALLGLVASLWVATVPFALLVRYAYPVLGWMGVAVGVGYVAWAIALRRAPPARRGLGREVLQIAQKQNFSKNAY